MRLLDEAGVETIVAWKGNQGQLKVLAPALESIPTFGEGIE
ncbi:MAG: hypothetical protein R3C62_18450 [Chloroflexota bacterium]